ncbi:MAG: prefoldin subunit alpha [Candidatus Thermoplasmatota archaeon]
MARDAAPAQAPEDPRQLAAQFEFLQRQLQGVDRRLAQLEQALVEAQQAASTVQGLAEAAGAQDTLLPIGSGVHVHAKVDPSAPVLLPIGAGYFTEGPAKDIVAALGARVEAITKSFQETSADAERLAQAASAINSRLESLSPQ